MRTTVWTLAVLTAGMAIADEKDDAKNFIALHRELKKRLPTGWELKSDLKTGTTADAPALPRLVVRSEKALFVETITINASPIASRPKSMVVEVELLFRPYVSPQQYTRLKKENETRRNKRNVFARKSFSGMRWYDVKSGQLYEPKRLKPKTVEQKWRALEYSFLWIATVPHSLPTHHYKSLSFDVWTWPSNIFYLPVKADNEKFSKVIGAINSVLTPYSRPAKGPAEVDTPPTSRK